MASSFEVLDFDISPKVFEIGDTITYRATIKNNTSVNFSRVSFFLLDVGEGSSAMQDFYAYYTNGIPANSTVEVIMPLTVDSVKPKTRREVEENGKKEFNKIVIYPYGIGSYSTTIQPSVYIVDKKVDPKIVEFDVSRCNSSGEIDDEGEYALCDLKLSVRNTIDSLHMSLFCDGTEVDITSRISEAINGIVDSRNIITSLLSNVTHHVLKVKAWYDLESDEREVILPRSFANVHMSGAANGGVCLGGFSTSTDNVPKFESYYPAYLYGGIESVAVTKYDALTYASGFEAYPGHEPLVTRVGCLVILDGMIRATASKATSSDVVMATLPEWACPRVRVNMLMQGSGAHVWWLEIYPEGTVCATRYRPTNSTSYASIASGAQLPVSAMWIAADAYPTEVQTASDTVAD